jgi:hypothetical protein
MLVHGFTHPVKTGQPHFYRESNELTINLDVKDTKIGEVSGKWFSNAGSGRQLGIDLLNFVETEPV